MGRRVKGQHKHRGGVREKYMRTCDFSPERHSQRVAKEVLSV